MAVHIQRAELTQFEQRVVQSMVDDNEGDCGSDVIQYGMTLAEFVEHCETLFPTEEQDIRAAELAASAFCELSELPLSNVTNIRKRAEFVKKLKTKWTDADFHRLIRPLIKERDDHGTKMEQIAHQWFPRLS